MNIAIIPGLLYDDDFKFFSEDTYRALDGVLNDVLSKMLKAYMDNPNAEPDIITAMETTVKPTVISYTLHLEFEKRQIFDMLQNLQPDTILQTTQEYQQDIYGRLKFVYDNYDNIVTIIPARSSLQFERWKSALNRVSASMSAAGTTWKVPNMMQRLKANSSLFYAPREKDRNLPSHMILNMKDRWLLALRAIEWGNYCGSRNIPFDKRNAF